MSTGKKKSEETERPVSLPGKRRVRTAFSRPTIGDVAELAGVARPTVSAILNNRPHCFASAATRARVVEASKRLGYSPSPMARALHGQPTATVGLVVPSLDVESASRKMAAFEAAAHSDGRVTILVANYNEPATEDRAIRWLMDRYVDGICVYPTEHGKHEELRRLAAAGFPLVTLDGTGRLDFATYDQSVEYATAGRLQAQHLLDLGRKRIGLLTATETCYVNDRKVEGFEAVMAQARHVTYERLQVTLPNVTRHAAEIGDYNRIFPILRERAADFDGLAALGDHIALAIIRMLTELGKRVPDDVAVVGQDGVLASSEGAIPLTTVAQHHEQVGTDAYHMLRDLMNKTPMEGPRQVKSPVWLIERASTRGVALVQRGVEASARVMTPVAAAKA